LQLQRGRRFLDVFSRELKSIVYNKKDPQTLFALKDREFYGKPASEMTFTTLSGLEEGIYRMEYYMREENPGYSLHKKIVKLYQNSQPMEITVLDDVDSFHISIQDKEKWAGSWNTETTKKLPGEIEISVVLRLKDRLFNMSRRVRPMIEERS
jgi:general secretion pathway protein J